MNWMRSKNESKIWQGRIIAIESVSVEAVQTLFTSIERELITGGYQVRQIEFPTTNVKQNIPAVFELPHALESEDMLGLVAAVDRAMLLVFPHGGEQSREAVLISGSRLATAAWLATTIDEYNDRVSLYRWLEKVDQVLLKAPKADLTVYVDMLPDHVGQIEQASLPAGWLNRNKPAIADLRESFLEAAQLTAGVKVVPAHKNGKLMPDGEIHNRVWNLVRRIALKTNLPPT